MNRSIEAMASIKKKFIEYNYKVMLGHRVTEQLFLNEDIKHQHTNTMHLGYKKEKHTVQNIDQLWLA
jgi:hypothetical protein